MNQFLNQLTPEKKKEIINKSGGIKSFTGCDLKNLIKNFEPSSYFSLIYQYYKLWKARFPFKKEDLTMQEWFHLSELINELEKPKL